MLIVLETLLILNYIAVIIYVISNLIKKRSIALVLIFVFLPIIGFIIFYTVLIYLELKKDFNYDKEPLVRRVKLEDEQNHPLMAEELNIVPIVDATAVSSLDEKRSLVLNQFRKSVMENYRFVLGAENDSDSELAHYIAAAKMEVYRRFQKKSEEEMLKYNENTNSLEALHSALSAIEEYINSQVLSEKEQDLYMDRYCELYQRQNEMDKDIFTVEEQNNYLSFLVKRKKFNNAIDFFNTIMTKKNEEAYLNILSMFYEIQKKEEFYECLGNLEKDYSIHLSSEGLEKLRYWRERGKEYAVD